MGCGVWAIMNGCETWTKYEIQSQK
jgi:hypothetical protein